MNSMSHCLIHLCSAIFVYERVTGKAEHRKNLRKSKREIRGYILYSTAEEWATHVRKPAFT